jgi:RHS repeat-associated protein
VNGSVTDTVFYYDHADWLGTGRARTNLAGAACETIQSLPFGDGQATAGSCGDISPLHFTGKERDTESGLDNFGARYNASSMGRFMSPDPSNWGAINESPQTWNAYSYVANNPLNATDPDGLDCVYTSGQSSSSVTVTVVRGDCLSDKDNGVYVNGTVDVNSLTYNGRTGDLGFSYTNPEEGSIGVGIDALGKPSNNSGQLNPYAQAVFSQRSLQTAAATMNDPQTYALWFGASATLGYGLYAAGAFEAGGALTTLSGENGLDLIGNRAINQMIGDGQRELLKEFFETGKAPEGLTDKSLQLYKEVAQRAIAAGKDQLGVQAQRLQMITSALK